MKDIFFLDLDETLLDFPKAEKTNFIETMRAFGIAADEGMCARFHAINDGLWKVLERGGITRAALKYERYRLLFSEYGIAIDPKAPAEAYYAAFPGIFFPYEGSAAFLKELSRHGRVYITTNGGAAIQRKHIAGAGYAPYLSGVFISEEVGYDKPSEAYCAAVKNGVENFDAARAVYLGDSLTSDMVCADRLGVDFILFRNTGRPQGFCGKFAGDYPTALGLMTGGKAE